MYLHISSAAFLVILLAGMAIFFLNRWLRKIGDKDEQEFLDELVKHHNKWADRGRKDYADSYKLLIAKYTMPEENIEA